MPTAPLSATVQGDIHDIGKNIVKMLLENYGFTVIDLAAMSPPSFVAAARDTGARLIGLSALTDHHGRRHGAY
ncbi:MAG: cobalamin-dependent protein [Adlercreutzia equolifaciens]